MRTQSEDLAAFALDLQGEQIPGDIIEIAKTHLLDAIGIALASSSFEFAGPVLAGARALGSGGAASAIGSGEALPPASAALVNGTLIHGLDFDDTHIGAIYHASAPALAAALAVAQSHAANGAALLEAYVVGLEIGCRIAGAVAGELHNQGYHPTAVCGVFAAAAAAGRLEGISQDALVSALGLSGSQAAGILEISGAWNKRLHPGWAAHAGIAAVALAKNGFLGPREVFEGTFGFYRSHVGHLPETEHLPARGLGEEWRIEGIGLKPYPCCHLIHSFVDAVLALRGEFDPDEVEAIDCPLTETLHPILAEPRELRIRPPIAYDALFSVPYVVALALVRGRVDLDAFYAEPLDDPEILRVAALTTCSVDEQSDYPAHFPGEVRVRLKDGRVLRRREPYSRGTPERRLSREAVSDKFFQNSRRAVPTSRAEAIVEHVFDIENQNSIDDLLRLCVSDEGSPS